MRLIVMGQQAFGQAVFERLLKSDEDQIISVYCAPDRDGHKVDPLKAAAMSSGIPVRQPTSFNDEKVLSEMRRDKSDLLIMAYVTLFVPQQVREIPVMGSICFHPSLLPLHRGPSSINWSIIAGATKTGFSWFYPTDGLDEGDILYQEECTIGADDTLGDVYFKKIFPTGVASVDTVCQLFRSGHPPRVVQDESQASYEGWCRKSDVEIDWRQSASVVYNLIRGSNPQPGAWTEYQDHIVQIYDSQKIDGKGHPPGQIVQIDDEGIVVQAREGQIRVKRVRPDGESKMTAHQWAEAKGVKLGNCLGRHQSFN